MSATVAQIMDAVLAVTGLTLDDVASRSRVAAVTRAREVLVALGRERGMSYPEITTELLMRTGSSHSTATEASYRLAARDPERDRILEAVRARLGVSVKPAATPPRRPRWNLGDRVDRRAQAACESLAAIVHKYGGAPAVLRYADMELLAALRAVCNAGAGGLPDSLSLLPGTEVGDAA